MRRSFLTEAGGTGTTELGANHSEEEMIDPVTEACWRVRDEIVKRAGGVEGYFDQLEKLDRQRLKRKASTAARRKKPAKPAKKRSTKRKRPS